MTPQFQSQLDTTYARLRKGVESKPLTYDRRIDQLKALLRMLDENDAAISQALWQDLRKSPFECAATEQGVVRGEINDAIKNLKRWMRPRRVGTPMYNWPGRSEIVYDPLGLTLVIGAWNYPINLTLAPLVGAIAGGNACIVKPSEISVATGELIGELIPKYLDPELYSVVQGGPEETGLLLDKKFDLIFFTGSGPVGKIVLAKAAPQLTPVVLELGGKSPAIVLQDADIGVTARRLAWGKFMNAGQTCIAPDYLIVHPSIRDELTHAISKCVTEFFGPDSQKSPDYCRIVNEKNFDRLEKLIEAPNIVFGGRTDRADKFIEPTLLNATPESPAMQDEIFGPIFPVLTFETLTEIMTFINARPKPLALYVFTKDSSAADEFATKTTSGGMIVNDVVLHMPEPELPFGGVGASGTGRYHGRFSFETFSHAKGVLHKSFMFDVPVRYAPYTDAKARLLKWLFK